MGHEMNQRSENEDQAVYEVQPRDGRNTIRIALVTTDLDQAIAGAIASLQSSTVSNAIVMQRVEKDVKNGVFGDTIEVFKVTQAEFNGLTLSEVWEAGRRRLRNEVGGLMQSFPAS